MHRNSSHPCRGQSKPRRIMLLIVNYSTQMGWLKMQDWKIKECFLNTLFAKGWWCTEFQKWFTLNRQFVYWSCLYMFVLSSHRTNWTQFSWTLEWIPRVHIPLVLISTQIGHGQAKNEQPPSEWLHIQRYYRLELTKWKLRNSRHAYCFLKTGELK